MMQAASELSSGMLPASGLKSELRNLTTTLRSSMKGDPESYVTEVELIYRQFKSSVHIFQQQSTLQLTSAVSGGDIAKDLGDRASLLAHVTPVYPKQLAHYPNELVEFIRSHARVLPSSLRLTVTKALIFLVNRKILAIKETLELMILLQVLCDRDLKERASSHVLNSIKDMNQKHTNETENRTLQNILFSMLEDPQLRSCDRNQSIVLFNEDKAMRALVTLCHLHRSKVWCDDRTSNAICRACFHSSSRIVVAAVSFLLGYEKFEQENASDESSDDEQTIHQSHVVVSKEAIYKAKNTGTTSSKKKKKAKLQRVIRSMKKKQRGSLNRDNNFNYSSPLASLNDPQEFAEKLFSKARQYRFEIKLKILKVVAHTIGLHRLVLLNFYPFLVNYIEPSREEVTDILAVAVQACHDMVPAEAVEELFNKIVNEFVHGHGSAESLAVGLNVVREICLRMPLLMREDLLQDLVLYKKSHSNAVKSAARSLISLFREIYPSLLVRKDRGRPINPTAKPKAFGEVTIPSDVPGADLLVDDDVDNDVSNDDDDDVSTHEWGSEFNSEVSNDVVADLLVDDDVSNYEDENDQSNDLGEEYNDSADDVSTHDAGSEFNSEVGDDDVSNAFDDDDDDDLINDLYADDGGGSEFNFEVGDEMSVDYQGSEGKKRKFVDLEGKLDTASQSLRALKRVVVAVEPKLENNNDGILSNEDFERIKELKAKEDARITLARHGLLKKGSDPKFKISNSHQLILKRVGGYALQDNIREKMTKEERQACIKAGRQDTGIYQSKAAIKRQKTGGLSNRQKEHKKAMPFAAKRSKIERCKRLKTVKQRGAHKQFRGRKAWK